MKAPSRPNPAVPGPAKGPGAAPAAMAPVSVETLAGELDGVLSELHAQISRLCALAEQRRAALRSADAARLGALITEENQVVQGVADLEKRRLGVVTQLADCLALRERGQARASEVAARVGGTLGERLGARAAVVRERLEHLSSINGSLAMASAHLASHMEGLLRQAAQVLNHAKTYARTGAVVPAVAVVSALDLSS